MRHRQRLAQGRIKHNRLYPDGLDAAAQEASNEAAIVRTTRLLWVIAGAMAAALVVADWVAGLSFDITKGWTMPTIIVALLALAWMSRTDRRSASAPKSPPRT